MNLEKMWEDTKEFSVSKLCISNQQKFTSIMSKAAGRIITSFE